jgi:hypothetical protein
MEQICARNCKIPNHVLLIDYRTFFLPSHVASIRSFSLHENLFFIIFISYFFASHGIENVYRYFCGIFITCCGLWNLFFRFLPY